MDLSKPPIKYKTMRYLLTIVGLWLLIPTLAVADNEPPKASILFQATFDKSPNAARAKGDGQIYTAESLERKTVQPGLAGEAVRWEAQGGRDGGALHFVKPTKQLVFFKGGNNVPYQKNQFAGSVSLWMRLSPRDDLPKGYVDPLQITDKKWNDASFFVDFDQAESRDFRLGAFADFKSWNPTNRKFEAIPVKERPMVVVEDPPFSRDQWTHVAFSWSKLNTDEVGQVTLYLNGKRQGHIRGKHVFTWKPEDVVIMLGINYIGWIDDVTIFDREIHDWNWVPV